MSNVIDGKDLFALKTGLDQATKNLEIISAGLSGGGVFPGDFSEEAIAFVEQFLAGDIASHYDLLEDSEALYDLMAIDESRYQVLIGYVIRYGHRDCHCLSIALSEANPNVRLLKVVSEAGFPVHSCVAGADDDLALDANGVHHRKLLVEYWSRVTGSPVRILPTTAEELLFFSAYEEDALAEALNGFGYLSIFMAENQDDLSIARPMEMSEDEDDLDLGI